MLTAYVVLRDHPLASGAAGPSITVTPATVTAYQAGTALGESEVAVTAGENLTELQALEGLLVDSGNDIATLLADWDAGSIGAFVAKMNRTASELRLGSTHITDPSGQDAATTSTPDDLIRLGEAALSLPTLRQIVDLGQANLPKAGLVYNLDFDLGLDGIIGIETGSDTAANGCYLFAAQRSLGGTDATVIGVVLGQTGPTGPNNAAVDAGDALVKASEFSLGAHTVVPAGSVVGQLTTPWGASTPVTAAAAVTVLGWPGLSVPASVHLDGLVAPLTAGATVGVLRVQQDAPRHARGAADIGSPSGSLGVVALDAMIGPRRVLGSWSGRPANTASEFAWNPRGKSRLATFIPAIRAASTSLARRTPGRSHFRTRPRRGTAASPQGRPWSRLQARLSSSASMNLLGATVRKASSQTRDISSQSITPSSRSPSQPRPPT